MQTESFSHKTHQASSRSLDRSEGLPPVIPSLEASEAPPAVSGVVLPVGSSPSSLCGSLEGFSVIDQGRLACLKDLPGDGLTPAEEAARVGGRPGMTGREEGRPGRSPLGYVCIRGMPEGLEILQSGVRFYRGGVTATGCSAGGKRGNINGLSRQTASRLRRFLLSYEVPESRVWKVTLTLPGEHDPELWEKLSDSLKRRAYRAGVGYVWRVELQRRKVPHYHVVAFVPKESKAYRVFTEGWLLSLPEDRQRMKGARKHCCHAEPMPENDCGAEWFGYLVGHTGKGKKDQLGWKGKQWGVVGRRLFHRVSSEFVGMGGRARARFQRGLCRLLQDGAKFTMWNNRRDDWKKLLRELGPVQRKLFRRQMRVSGQLHRVRRLPGVNGWERVMDPRRLSRLIEWAQGGVSRDQTHAVCAEAVGA